MFALVFVTAWCLGLTVVFQALLVGSAVAGLAYVAWDEWRCGCRGERR